jgi:hypothetical protein
MRRDWKPEWADDVSADTVEALRGEYMPELPPLSHGGYLISYLMELGPTMAAGMGAGPISHQEILAWQALTGITLQPWETRFLRRLSGEYLNEQHRAEKLGCIPPWKPADYKPEPTAAQLALRALANK